MLEYVKPLSMRAIAKELGVTEGAIRKAVKAGRITGEITLENVRYCLSSTQTQRAKVNIGASEVAQPIKPVAPLRSVDLSAAYESESITENLEGMTLVEVRTIRECIGAKKDELELRIKESSLADTDGVAKAAQLYGRMVREAIEAIPAKIASQVAAETDPLKVIQTLEQAIKAALNQVAGALDGNG